MKLSLYEMVLFGRLLPGSFALSVSVNAATICYDASNTGLIENKAVTPKWVATHSGVAPLFSMRTGSLVSSQSCRNVDADAQSKRAFI